MHDRILPVSTTFLRTFFSFLIQSDNCVKCCKFPHRFRNCFHASNKYRPMSDILLKEPKKCNNWGRKSQLETIWIHMNPNLFYPMISGMRDLLISALSTTKIKFLFLTEFFIRLVMMEKFGISNCVTKRDFPNCKCSGELSMCKVKGKKDK